MKQFKNMLGAAKYAITLGENWQFAYSDETYDQ